jgi:hypothetical protein
MAGSVGSSATGGRPPRTTAGGRWRGRLPARPRFCIATWLMKRKAAADLRATRRGRLLVGKRINAYPVAPEASHPAKVALATKGVP